MSTVLSISGVGGSGPKATVVSFTVNEANERPWAWIPNNVAEKLRPGMRLAVESISRGKVETHRSDDPTVALVRPKVQIFLHCAPGEKIRVLKPEQAPVATEDDFVFEDDTDGYADRYDAKRDDRPVDGDEPF